MILYIFFYKTTTARELKKGTPFRIVKTFQGPQRESRTFQKDEQTSRAFQGSVNQGLKKRDNVAAPDVKDTK